jgi:hypothetical protein
MSQEVKTSMMLCWGLETAEQEKVERLDEQISSAFANAGQAIRECRGRNDLGRRFIDFIRTDGTGGISVLSSDFLTTSDQEVVAKLTQHLITRGSKRGTA